MYKISTVRFLTSVILFICSTNNTGNTFLITHGFNQIEMIRPSKDCLMLQLNLFRHMIEMPNFINTTLMCATYR